jgi:hypothetical protein
LAPSGGNIPRVTTPVLGCGGVATPGVMQYEVTDSGIAFFGIRMRLENDDRDDITS